MLFGVMFNAFFLIGGVDGNYDTEYTLDDVWTKEQSGLWAMAYSDAYDGFPYLMTAAIGPDTVYGLGGSTNTIGYAPEFSTLQYAFKFTQNTANSTSKCSIWMS
jgi:hypothetical protein